MARRRSTSPAFIGMVLISAIVAGGCGLVPSTPTPAFAPGRCVTYQTLDNGGDSLQSARCEATHTHRVVAFAQAATLCPADVDATFWSPEGTYCLKVDTEPRSDAP